MHVVRVDGKPLSEQVPEKAVLPFHVNLPAKEYTFQDARVLISDFGESFMSSTRRIGSECNTPVAVRPPETFFEPNAALSFPSDIWMLGMALWDVLAMKSLVSHEFPIPDEIIS